MQKGLQKVAPLQLVTDGYCRARFVRASANAVRIVKRCETDAVTSAVDNVVQLVHLENQVSTRAGTCCIIGKKN